MKGEDEKMSSFVVRCKKVLRRGGLNELFKWLIVKKWSRIIPDKQYLKIQYRLHTGKKLNVDDPKLFNEKLQWLKLYDHTPEYITMVDKYAAKEYVANIIGDQYIIPTLGVWDSFDEIDFDSLPNQFALKCTHDSGSVLVCRDKSKLDRGSAKKKLSEALNRNGFLYGREWPYKEVKARIIVEKYMEEKPRKSLKDYKFYCFNGKPKFLYLSEGLENHATAHISYVTLDWEKTPFVRTDYAPFETLPEKPSQFEKMKELAAIMAKGIPFSRIDFYEINKQVYFGEITFFPASGYAQFSPEEWDGKVGEWLMLPQTKRV
ncbi:ATP-grasp fold amidoligase family protein [Desulfosporosinus sp. FKA]|uniref:ATP-grasp fold amidoligase family protein n=1 Tax=Desulfosporosinus sp. FKA TaxID=1969834 RepID=UPI001FA84D82|nr:ATP-grasp fold amidoligase family protein [Desulfosporosinus sp. FKA]